MQPILYAVLADIHANFQALKAVEADAVNARRALDAQSLHFVVLGDIVDYGPQPNECMEWVEQHAEIVIQGNHDMEVMDSAYKSPRTINSDYWPITIWTRAVLGREHKSRMREWLPGLCRENGQLPPELNKFMLFHGSLTRGHHGTVTNSQDAWDNFQHLKDGITYGLFGHTHIQGYFVNDILWQKNTTWYLVCSEDTRQQQRNGKNQWKPFVLGPAPDASATSCTPWADLPADPAMFNPGAVGQPRSGPARGAAPHDNRAAYMLLKSNGHMQFQFRRTPYDVEETIRHLREDVYWPLPTHQNKRGSDILKEEGATTEMLVLMGDFPDVVRNMETRLPALVEVLARQLR